MSRSPRKPGDSTDQFTFTPILDIIAAQFGLVTAAVYGVVHRHCLMRDGICRASTRRMARLLGTTHITVQRHIRILVENGYLEDLTPDRGKQPHIFRDLFLKGPRPRRDPTALTAADAEPP